MIEEQKTPHESKLMLWLKRVGFWGFLFFLVKGLVWIGIFAYGYFWASKK
ncbi:MAG TPA: alanyl-tRNA synthetase [Flavipsychrobacter sp.]|nr:alanyl-tRNA synthetase [Flavipsychrobacter sp.]